MMSDLLDAAENRAQDAIARYTEPPDNDQSFKDIKKEQRIQNFSRQLTFEKQTIQVSDSRPPVKTDIDYSDAAFKNESILSS